MRQAHYLLTNDVLYGKRDAGNREAVRKEGELVCVAGNYLAISAKSQHKPKCNTSNEEYK